MDLVSGKFRKFISLFVCVLMTFNLCCVANAAEEKVDVKMLWTSAYGQTWNVVDENAKIFDKSALEPGDEVVRYFDIQNTGDLAIEYTLDFVIAEGVDLTLANAIDVYVKEDVAADTAVSDMTKIGTLADILANGTLSNGKISPDGEESKDGFASVARKVAVALKMQDTTEYFGKSLSGFKLQLIANETDYTYKQIERFSVKFPNTDKYLYRVGNENAVALSSLFANDSVIGKVNVTIENISGDAAGAYTANTSDWTKGTIQFTGTGSVRVTVDDEGRKTAPTSLCLEVIKATNATSATSAKTTDVVLLNDVGFSTLDVSGGHTLYGNGFTMTCGNDVYTQYMSYSFVKLENGTLDNVRVIVPNFSYAILYDSNKKDSENPYYQPSGTTAVNDRYYYNMRSAVVMEGKSRIVNSYISGGRAAVYARSGYHTIDNSTIYGGATANIHIVSAQNMTLKDTTLIQEPIQATVHDTSKTLMGFSVIAECDSTGLGAPITLEGDFVQYAWVHQGYSNYVPSAGSSFMNAALKKTDYMHSITYPDGTTANSLNLGIFYLPDGENDTIKPTNITDNRINKASIPYSITSVTALTKTAYIYSYGNSSGTADSYKTEPVYESKGQGNIQADLSYDDSAEADSFTTSFDSQKGKVYNLTVDLDKVDSYAFSFSNLKALKGGKELSYTVKDSAGNAIDKSATITLTDMQATEYTLTITDNASYNENGEEVSDKVSTYDCCFKLVSTKTSIDPPTLVGSITNETAYLVVKSQGGDWSCGLPASLDNINIKEYSKTAKGYVTVNLGTKFPISGSGKLNGTNDNIVLTNSDGSSLTVTCGVIHDTKGVKGMPIGLTVDSAKKLYFTISSTNGYVSTSTASRAVTITYKYTDPNGKEWNHSIKHNFNYADYSGGTQYKYSSFIEGTLADANSGGSSGNCLAIGTLITLADGSQKPIEDLTFSDQILVWDFFNGEYTTTVPSLLIDDGVDNYEIINLKFSDNSTLRVIYEHGLFDVAENDYILINKGNVEDYIGHTFIKYNGVENETVTLESYEITEEYIGCYTILTAFHNNCISNGLLTVTPPPVKGWYDYFEIGEGMRYDEAAMKADIEKYGLYSYEDFMNYITYDEYLAFNGAYLKILVGKGYFTFDDILEQIQVFGVGNGFIATAAEENNVGATIVIISGENSISTATYGISAVANNVVVENGSFIVDGNGVQLKITATGDAKSRYAKITLDGDVYYTEILAPGESVALTIHNANGQTVAVEAVYGTHENETVSVISLGAFAYAVDGASVTFYNTTKYDITDGFDVFVGIFGEGNQLLDIAKKSYEKFGAKTEDTFAPELKTTEGTIKTFIWKVGTMVPYDIKKIESPIKNEYNIAGENAIVNMQIPMRDYISGDIDLMDKDTVLGSTEDSGSSINDMVTKLDGSVILAPYDGSYSWDNDSNEDEYMLIYPKDIGF